MEVQGVEKVIFLLNYEIIVAPNSFHILAFGFINMKTRSASHDDKISVFLLQ
jgi:hypothetical protein